MRESVTKDAIVLEPMAFIASVREFMAFVANMREVGVVKSKRKISRKYQNIIVP